MAQQSLVNPGASWDPLKGSAQPSWQRARVPGQKGRAGEEPRPSARATRPTGGGQRARGQWQTESGDA